MILIRHTSGLRIASPLVNTRSLDAAYEKALYRLDIMGRRYTLSTLHTPLHAERLLNAANCHSLTIITVDNPGSQRCDRATFSQQHLLLTQQLRHLGIHFFPTSALAPQCDWPVEHGVAIKDLPLASAYPLNQRYHQNAFVRINREQGIALHWTNS